MMAVLALLAALAIDVVAHATRTVVDLTDDRALSVTAQTEAVVREVRRETTITAFLRPDEPERAPAAALLLRYQRLSPKIRFRILDPRTSAGELRRLGVDTDLGVVAVTRGSDVEMAATLTEQDVTAALVRLARGRSAEVCFTTGHGEASVEDESAGGLARAGALLVANGYRVRQVDLLAAPAVPTSCDALVVAGPQAPLGAAAEVIGGWGRSDGRLLVLADPAAPPDDALGRMTADLGLGLRRGIVLEGDPALALPDDPTAPIVRSYSSASPIVRKLPPTFFPGLQEVTVGDDEPEEGLTMARLADTSPASYLETEPLSSTYDVEQDVRGPITIAAAADAVRVDGDVVRRRRAVVVGDVDFATNAVFGEAANSTFLVRTLDWLTIDEELVVLSTNLSRSRPLTMTSARVGYARFLSLAVLPGVFVLSGAAVWALRRAR